MGKEAEVRGSLRLEVWSELLQEVDVSFHHFPPRYFTFALRTWEDVYLGSRHLK